MSSTFGPLIMAREKLEASGRWDALRSALITLYERSDPLDYLVVTGRKIDSTGGRLYCQLNSERIGWRADGRALTREGKMSTPTTLDSERLRAFNESFAGSVLQPADAAYEDARSIHNGLIDRRPALIARCATSADIAAAVRLATESAPRHRGSRRRPQRCRPLVWSTTA